MLEGEKESGLEAGPPETEEPQVRRQKEKKAASKKSTKGESSTNSVPAKANEQVSVHFVSNH